LIGLTLMTDDHSTPEDAPISEAPGPETPIQRALRLKQAAIDAKPKPPRGGRFQREQAAAARSTSKSKPWMTR
jgi:hypothetical protein